MTVEPNADNSYSPTVSRGSVIMFLAIAAVFGFIAVWPSAPPFVNLTKEEAHVQRVWKVSLRPTVTSLKTSSGLDVKCMYSKKTGGCYPETMKSFLESNTPVMVWHDGEKVFQLIAQDKMILPYEHFLQGWGVSGAISIISLIAALIQVAILKGFIGVATTKNPES